MGDLAMSKDIIFVGFIVASILGLLVTLLMSFPILATIWIWISMLINMLCLIILGAFSYQEYKQTIETRCYDEKD
jgi:uncharacterized protein YacL